jgi:hypothetical protein
VLVDGGTLPGRTIPLAKSGTKHQVTVEMG